MIHTTDEEYLQLTGTYEDAKEIMLSRLNILNHNLYVKPLGQPVHNIQDRIKKKESLEEKLTRKGKETTLENAKHYIQDIAGIRVICYFVDDIYNLVNTLKKQSDLVVIRESDYIKAAKPNGYRSYHIIVGVPLYYTDGMEYFPVEIQLRTMAMDLWASMEHRILYKHERSGREMLAVELKEYAENLLAIEEKFEQYSVGKMNAEHFHKV